MQLRRFIVPAVVPIAFLVGLFGSTAMARQQPPSPVLLVGCMKVDPRKDAEYRRLEHDIWRPIHQERIRQGLMTSWTVYQVRFPYGKDNQCDYMTVNVHKSLADADRDIADVIAKVHPNTTMSDLFNRTLEARDHVRNEVWQQIDRAP